MNRIQELEKLITKYQHSYYTNEAEISDEEFDILWDELKVLDPENPILKKVGSDIEENFQTENSYSGGNFEKATHLIPMGSQEKAADPNAFLAWTKKVNFCPHFVHHDILPIQKKHRNIKCCGALVSNICCMKTTLQIYDFSPLYLKTKTLSSIS